MERNNKGQFMKGNIPHNKGKTKEDYKPLKKTSEKLKTKFPDFFRNALENKIYCKCGCGQEIIIKRKHRWDGIPEHIQGHHNRINHHMLGKHHTKKSKNKMRGRNKGKHFSLKTEFKKRDLRLIGKNNPNWNEGTAFEPYSKTFNNKFKRAIRRRDNQVCILCGAHQEKLNKTLFVHHIDYNKKLSIPQNCCALCHKCNSIVNFNREQWIKFFHSLLSKKYNYKYVQDKCIINII